MRKVDGSWNRHPGKKGFTLTVIGKMEDLFWQVKKIDLTKRKPVGADYKMIVC